MSGGNTSTALKSTTEEPASTADADAREAEDMVNAMLWDWPIPDAVEGGEKRQEEIPTGKPVVPFSLNFLGFLSFVGFVTQDFFSRSSKSRGFCGEN